MGMPPGFSSKIKRLIPILSVIIPFSLSYQYPQQSIVRNAAPLARHTIHTYQPVARRNSISALRIFHNQKSDRFSRTSVEYTKARQGSTVVSLSSSGNDEGTKSTVQSIFSLAVPALASLAIDPLMTLADTAFVGRTATNSNALAGMGSAAALLTFSCYLFNFLCTATTPLVASCRTSGDENGVLVV
eukprot:2964248-Ditylum_brightwellii.AAC.1